MMMQRALATALTLAAAALVAAGTSTAAQARTGVAASSPTAAEPAQGFIGPAYADLHAFAPDDVWGVGARYEEHHRTVTLAEHWDGAAWTVMRPPNPGAKENQLAAVSGTAPDDIWAVGHYWRGQGPDRLLAEHWDGSTWSQVRVPQGHSSSKHLFAALGDVDAVSADDVWAVGYLAGPVVEHWDGTAWSSVPVPPGGRSLYGVSATSARDAWAVGQAERSGRSLIWHWDGATWTPVEAREGDAGFHSLTDVVALSPENAWAVGAILRYPHVTRPLFLHWDGSAWQRVSGAPIGGRPYDLTSVSGSGADDVWVAGIAQGDDGYDHAVLQHWDGTRWRITTLPADLAEPALRTVSADSADDAWLQGSELDSRGGAQVVGRWDGTDWRHVDSP